MVVVRNEDIELVQEINAELKDQRVEMMLKRWIEGRNMHRERVRKAVAEGRKIDKNYGRERSRREKRRS